MAQPSEINPAAFEFRALKGERDRITSTFAYWIGVASDLTAPVARSADEACAAMSVQYSVEEQAFTINDLRPTGEGASSFRPIAPVTLAYRWSPFPAAFAAMGSPVHADLGPAGSHRRALAVFRPPGLPTSLRAKTPDERHFRVLLRCASERAGAAGWHVLLAGQPGWSYYGGILEIVEPEVRRMMTAFGYVCLARRPGPYDEIDAYLHHFAQQLGAELTEAGREALHDILFENKANPRAVFEYVEEKKNAFGPAGHPLLERMLASFYERFCP